MNTQLVKRLVLKDWYFFRWAIAGYIFVGMISLILVGLGGKGSFYAGSILLISVLIGLGIHLAMETVVNERKKKNLVFVMSLPISIREYTVAKILANLLIFLIPWIVLVFSTDMILFGLESLPSGMLPFATLMLTQILVGYCFVLCIALVLESEGWTIVAVVVTNLFFHFFLYYVSHIPSVKEHLAGPDVVWSREMIGILVGQFMLVILLFGLTFYFQARKKDFL